MARVTILYWQDIPSLVEAKDAEGSHKIQLSDRFQELIDTVAMRKKLFGTDEYLTQWRKGRPQRHQAASEAAAGAVAAELESRYDAIREEELAKCRSSRES